jgi:beta-mannosidase
MAFSGCYLEPREVVDLGGIWEYSLDADGSSWQEIRVPANWHLAGLAEHHGKVWYRRQFYFTRTLGQRMAHLRFLGVDYYARVWLNDTYLGRHEGYFQSFDFDVTDVLKEENTLLVEVDSPKEDPQAWLERKRLIKGVLSMSDCRPGAWNPELGQDGNTGGIWNRVEIVLTNPTHVDRMQISPLLLADGSARLNVDVSMHSAAAQECDILVRVTHLASSEPVCETRKKASLVQGPNHRLFIEVVKEPKLWWCWDRGEQNLYTVQVILDMAGQVIDRFEDRCGIRETYIDEKGEWYLNGERIFPRGTNFLPAQWLSEYTQEKIGGDIEMLREANVNAIRLHAHVNREELYHACDEAGILVWQDFPLQWVYDDEDPEFDDAAATQVREMVRFLYNRPCIFVWACHNEPHRNLETLDPILLAIVKEADGTRPAFEASTADSHTYPGREAPARPLVTEFGAQALPCMALLRDIFAPEELFPPDWEKWAYHCFSYHEMFHIAQVEMGPDIEAFLDNSQEYQARLIQFAIESYRRQKYRLVWGLFQFMFVDCWPSITWSVVDYYRVRKKGFHALKQAYQPVLISIENREEKIAIGSLANFGLTIINDLGRELPDARWSLRIRDPQGKMLDEVKGEVDISPDSLIVLGNALRPTWRWRLVSTQGEILSTNSVPFYVFSSPGWPRGY